MTPRRWIAHLDMDAFYASVELLRYPELRGQAVVIGGGRRHQPERLSDGTRRFATLRHYTGRGVITTATYAARDLGVHSGMGLMKAALRAPDAVLLPVDFDEYRRYSRLFKAAVAEVAPVIEDRGIDEIYIDLTEVPGAQDAVGHDATGGVRALAQDIRNNVRQATGLTCSIGVTPNKLLAKIASELDKPDGLTILTEADIAGRVWPLAVRKINGIGPKAGARLQALGIDTVGQLAACSRDWLMEHFGRSYGRWLHDASARRRRPAGGDAQRAGVDEPRDHLRPQPARQGRPGRAGHGVHAAVPAGGHRPAAQGLPRAHHRHQAALRGLPHRHTRPDAGRTDRRRRGDPPCRRPVPEARGPDAAAAPAGRARRQPDARARRCTRGHAPPAAQQRHRGGAGRAVAVRRRAGSRWLSARPAGCVYCVA
jgi:nucleotidyltransferase/DNA polymerase involved in DNA repair